jgi:hypothetical protein
VILPLKFYLLVECWFIRPLKQTIQGNRGEVNRTVTNRLGNWLLLYNTYAVHISSCYSNPLTGHTERGPRISTGFNGYIVLYLYIINSRKAWAPDKTNVFYILENYILRMVETPSFVLAYQEQDWATVQCSGLPTVELSHNLMFEPARTRAGSPFHVLAYQEQGWVTIPCSSLP